uniref:receptor protein-tyrosine kinase n=1 Tax=Ciona savignyi TaxID=51511 RepID=Q95YL0_CIOSA|nr:EPH receptor tyrosine kinase [Ciona savignyi]
MDYLAGLIPLIIGLSIQSTSSEEVTILDTTQATSDLGWTSTGTGWTELTNTDETDADLRTFQVCHIRSPHQNNWLRSDFINVTTTQRVYVEIKFTIRSCDDIRRVVSCKETFNLYYLESNHARDPRSLHLDESTYTKVDTIAADERFKPDTRVQANTETRIISPIQSDGLYLAFQDTGACMSIMHVRVYYKSCSQTLHGLAVFPPTISGPEMTSLIDVPGQCVPNSMIMKNTKGPSLHCNGEGNWLVPSGSCKCDIGYEPNKELTECNQCRVGKFKSEVGNFACQSCPKRSFNVDFASSICMCISSYYRSPNDMPDSPCTKPPAQPSTLQSSVNKTIVQLTWLKPRNNGGRTDVTYSVTCERCDATYTLCSRCGDGADFIPGRTRLTKGSLLVRDLAPHTDYVFKVFSFNGVSAVSGLKPAFAQIRVRTNQAAPSAVQPIRVVMATAREVLIRWDPPKYSNGHIIDYQIQYSSVHGLYTNVTARTTYRLSNLTPSTSYIVQVRARSKFGYGLYSRASAFRTKALKSFQPQYIHTNSNSASEKPSEEQNKDISTTKPADNHNPLVVAVCVACSFLVITLCALFFICGKRGRYAKTLSSDLEKYPGFINSSVDLLSTKTYVDPSTYEDPYSLIKEFASEIDSSIVRIEQVIGRGEFGEVCKGSFSRKTVAIKTLKVGYSTQERSDFLSEASIMGQFDHPNVIRLEGVVTKSRPLMIITEFMENGSLDAFLRIHEGKLSSTKLTEMLNSIACGMEYLANMGYVHRDLAARNILINSQFVCKVSDFGLSRILEQEEEEDVAMYTTRGGMIPIRWTAPEAITMRTFSTSSDVWSFAIVMWEVLSFGERPYWEMSNQDVVQFVDCGYRLPPPCYCPRIIHSVMLECWNKDRTSRPNFSHLVTIFNRFLQEPSCLNDIINNRPFRDQEDCIPEMLDLSSLGQWLDQMNMLKYKPMMMRHGCVTAEQIMRLNPSELTHMGFIDTNDVNTVLRQADLLRKKIEEVGNVGIAV